MFYKYPFLILVFYFASVVFSNNVATPCDSDDSCAQHLLQATIPKISKGFPEFGVERGDPLYIGKIEGDLSILKYKLFNSTVIGFSDCTYSEIKVSQDLKLHFVIDCSKLKMSGKYETNGRLVIMPVEGNGDYTMITGKYNIVVDSDLKTSAESDGKTHLSIKNFKLKCTPLSAITFDFKNLFNGQKDLSDAVHKFANENWKEVADFVQDPVWYGCVSKIMKNLNKYLKHVALEDFKKI